MQRMILQHGLLANSMGNTSSLKAKIDAFLGLMESPMHS